MVVEFEPDEDMLQPMALFQSVTSDSKDRRGRRGASACLDGQHDGSNAIVFEVLMRLRLVVVEEDLGSKIFRNSYK